MFRLRKVLRPLAVRARVAGCGWKRIAPAVEVGLRNGRAHYHGLLRCGSVWECPVCTLAIRAERADEVRKAVEWHGQRRTALLTLTVRHGLGEDLAQLRRGVADAWRRVAQGREWQEFKACLAGTVRALEVTHGPNGWHPHLHVLLLLDDTARSHDLDALRAWFSARWMRAVGRALGADNVPNDEHGTDLRPAWKADYLAKLGLEVTDPGTKRGRRRAHRTPLQIAASYDRGRRERDRAIWLSYAAGIFGARMLTWSAGLRTAAGIGREKTDEEIVDGEDAPETQIAIIPGDTWDALRSHDGAEIQILVAAERGGRDAVVDLVTRLVPTAWTRWTADGRPAGDHDFW